MNVVAFAPPPDPTVSVALDVLRDFQDLLAARAAGATAPEGSSLRDGMVRMAAEALLHLHDFDARGARDARRRR